MKKLWQRYQQYWQVGLAAALSVIAIVLSVVALTSQRDGTLDPAVQASILGETPAAASDDPSSVSASSDSATSSASSSASSVPSSSGASAAGTTEVSPTSGGVNTPAVAPVAVFIGVGYTAGANSSVPAKRWTSLVSARLGWTEVNLGFAGTGYLKTGTDRGNYITTIPDVVAAAPAYVIVSGGRNDVDQPNSSEKIAISTYLTQLKTAVPTAKIIVLSPVWDDDAVPAVLTTIATDVQAAAATAGATYLDIGQPLTGRSDLISGTVYPNDAGHEALSNATLAAVAAAKIAAA